MRLDDLFSLLAEARKLSGHQDYVVIGSLSILGLEPHFSIPDGMTMSNGVACYTRDDPPRIFDVLPALGENSPYHQRAAVYLDAVAPELPSLPDGWRERLVKVERDGVRAWFLDPNDAALSKYARGEPRDRRWIQAGILAGVVSLPIVNSRLSSTNFLDDDEQRRATALVTDDVAWFASIQGRRSTAKKAGKGSRGRSRDPG